MRHIGMFSVVVLFVLSSSCSGPSKSSSASSATPASPANADAQSQSAPQIDPCSKFTAADAQEIMGVPMKFAPGHGAIVCMYEEVSPKSGGDTARLSLTLNVRKSPEEENRAWNNIKIVRHLKTGEKNIAQLSGVGDEAWWDGNTEKGNVGVGGVIARKGRSDFMLESAVFAYRASADQIKNIAKRIADQLP